MACFQHVSIRHRSDRNMLPNLWRGVFTPTRLTRAGIAADKQEAYLNAVDYIGNLELLLEHEKIKKSNQPFDEWLVTRDASFKERHLIPADPELYTLDRFLDFIDQREALIKRRLTTLFGSVSVGMKRPTDTTIPLASASTRSMS